MWQTEERHVRSLKIMLIVHNFNKKSRYQTHAEQIGIM